LRLRAKDQRTALEYFFGPIRAVFRKGMRER